MSFNIKTIITMKMKTTAIRIMFLAAFVLAGSHAVHAQKAAETTATALRPGLRTNLLAWACGSASLGADLQWGTRWQAGIDGSIALKTAPDGGWTGSNKLAVSSVGAEVRRYFGIPRHSTGGKSSAHQGLYLGLGTRYLKFDCLKDAQATGREGTILTAGLILGYTFRLPARFTMDIAAGAGYLHKDYNRYTWYEPARQNRFLNSKTTNAARLTHAEISVAYHF